MNIILFDTTERRFLYPFTYTKPVAALRAGILTNMERWEKSTGVKAYALTADYLQPQWNLPDENNSIIIDARVLPDENLVKTIMDLEKGEAITGETFVIAGKPAKWLKKSMSFDLSSFQKYIPYTSSFHKIAYPWHLFQLNEYLLRSDIRLLTALRTSAKLSATNQVLNSTSVFIEEGAEMEYCCINATTGPVYIGGNAVIMEGSLIRGPFAAGEGAVVKMGSKIYGATTVGPYCTAGGEIKNSILMGYSNKAHDGYLGDSVIGEWCNIGAGTSNSNVRNDAGTVMVADESGEKKEVGLKCGLLMGDYTRSAINTSFNTGTFAGIASGIFGSGLAPKYLPNFTWGYSEKYRFDKAMEHINNWKRLKNADLSLADIQILEHLYKQTV
ncbi:MAG: glucose-1-phosphate thymidylyltransferase [Chitinophagaceae bacterium]|nr:glucose-1-phosphate thymidylyltransferase [Chitinophagaceae bacterium]